MNLLSTSPLARFQYQQTREQYLDYLLDHGDAAGARKVLDSFSSAEQRSELAQVAGLRLAAMENKLTGVLAGYTQNPADAPADSILQQTAAVLSRAGLANAQQQILEFLYSRQIENSGPPAAYLGLAEIRVKQGRLDQATDLLKTLNQISTTPFEQLLASARVFSESGHPREAQDFLKERVQAVPWDSEARLELAKTESALNRKDLASADLQKVVISREAPYDVRTQAAREQAKTGAGGGTTGTREMDLLSNRVALTADSADAPFFFAARIAAAEQVSDPAVKVRLLSGAISERPADSTVRRNLFSAALASRQYRVALAVERRDDDEGLQLRDADTASGLADAHQQLGEFADAMRFFKLAASLEKDNARRQTFEERAKQAQSANERRMEDERRRPAMRADLDQPNVVGRRVQ
jgi:tetratricopeptide (TPR) repeat protein